MGKEKGGFLTPKAIANRIKSKGLQKLRWFCQMCQKQCRDENGFKCHLMSESHQRQLLLFAENPDKFIDTYSTEFIDTFMELLKRRFGTKRVHANIVYQEYIADKEHTHMNSTQWETLSDFVKWLGRDGKCIVDQTEKGWFMQYVDRDPDTIRRQEALEKRDKMVLDDEERATRFIEQQIERAASQQSETATPAYTELCRSDDADKVAFTMAGAPKASSSKIITSNLKSEKNTEDSAHKRRFEEEDSNPATQSEPKRKSALSEIIEMEEKKKERQNRKENWLHTGIVVKIITKKLGQKYHKSKAVVKEVEDLFLATVKVLDGGDKLKLDQAHLETVIPAIGKAVLIVNGAHRGSSATLVKLDEKKFSCTVKISEGPSNRRVIDGLPYEDISKLHHA